jgi:hypothetical protein
MAMNLEAIPASILPTEKIMTQEKTYHDRMAINSAPGTKVLFDNEGGTSWDKGKSLHSLTLGMEYTVKKTHMDSFRTEVELEEVPHVKFNSCQFAVAVPMESSGDS